MSGPVKAYLKTELDEQINCLFNPEQLTMSRTVSWDGPKSNKANAPSITFGGGESGTLSFDLIFDTTDSGESVTIYTTKLLMLMDIHEFSANEKRPPWVRFHWGDMISFKAVVTTATIKFTYFAADGTPLRATATGVTLKQMTDEAQWKYALQNPTSGTRQRERQHRVMPGETLDRISYTYYGDSGQWRRIAERNGILDPLRLRVGRMLTVPELQAVPRG